MPYINFREANQNFISMSRTQRFQRLCTLVYCSFWIIYDHAPQCRACRPAHSKETGVLEAHATAALLTFYTAAEAAEKERIGKLKHYYNNKKLLQEHCKSIPHINAEYEYFHCAFCRGSSQPFSSVIINSFLLYLSLLCRRLKEFPSSFLPYPHFNMRAKGRHRQKEFTAMKIFPHLKSFPRLEAFSLHSQNVSFLDTPLIRTSHSTL